MPIKDVKKSLEKGSDMASQRELKKTNMHLTQDNLPKPAPFKLSLALTLLFTLVLFPIIIILRQAPADPSPLGKEELNLLFIVLACATLPLAGITANSWPKPKSPAGASRKFSGKYRILTPLDILADRKLRKDNQRRANGKKLPKVIHMPSDHQKQEPPPAVTLPQWAALPLFQQNPEDPMESLLDLAANPLLIINNDGCILAANQNAQETLELTQENTKSLRITDIIPRLFPDPDEEGDPVQKFTFRHHDTEVVGIARQTNAHTANGKRIPVHLRMSKQQVFGTLVIVLEIMPQ
jgi:PAS domain-containing protein